jgi:hypothetical protein
MSSAPGVKFREVMRGGFAPHATDPVAGGRTGAQAGSVLALHLVAIIRDAARFAQDPEHEGELRGSVTFGMLSADMPIVRGTFQLFVPTSDSDLKLMVYRASFEHAGASYYLDGAKHVRRRSVVHSWTDTTTLYCRLHAGTDAEAPVIAAGVLRLGALDFAKQLLSFRTIDAPTISDKARALATFFTFFSREVLDTYIFRVRRPASRPTDVRQ